MTNKTRKMLGVLKPIEEPLTFEEIVAYLHTLNDRDWSDFVPFRFFHGTVENENYSPETFDGSIEASEPDYEDLARKNGRWKEYIINIGCKGDMSDEPKNSKKWLDNHSKICKVKCVPNIMVGTATERRDNGVRDYCGKREVKLLKEWFDNYKNKGLNVYGII